MSEREHQLQSHERSNTVRSGRRRFLQLAGAGSVAALAGCLAGDNGNGDEDEDWEASQTVRYIIPYDQGGGTDVYARGIVEALTDAVGESIQIDNVPGAGGLNGYGDLMGADTDGHTILGSATPLEVAPQLLDDPGFDIRDPEGVCVFGESAWCLIVNEEWEDQVETFQDVLDLFEQGEMSSVGIQEPGSPQDIITLLARYEYGFWDWEERPQYTGTGPVAEAVASGEVPCGIGTDAGTRSTVEAGNAFPVVSFLSGGTEVYPDIPSIDEEVDEVEGDELDFVGGLFRGVYTPPETPEGRNEWLSERFAEAVEDDRTQEWSNETGNPVYHEGPEEAEAIVEEAFDAYEEFDVIGLIEEHN
jgi:tripartite-type tricarboxylate transporter receptor subunit TctC